jgi:2-polyprenyl-3-methyl-5-hydroxy-6-metoxy-1,4-benzoquinol methylase
LVYLNPRPATEDLIHLYPDEYDQYEPRSTHGNLLGRLDQGYGFFKRCRAVLQHKSDGRLLDIGCATGNFLAAMQRYPGWEVYGVEISPFASAYARDVLGLNVHTGTLETAQLPVEDFDVITLWDVIEHMPDPLESLGRMYRLLKPGGMLIMRTPNLNSWDARLFGRYWIGYELPRHLYVFSRATLGSMITMAGFMVEDIEVTYGSHAAAMSSVRFLMRDRWPASRWREVVEKLLFARALRLIVAPYFWLADRLILSSGPTWFCQRP